MSRFFESTVFTPDGRTVTQWAVDAFGRAEAARAQAWARRVLEGADLTLDWREAGYRTARLAAEALVGDHQDDPVWEAAVTLVAERLEAGA